jgi:hypothetical protein
MRGARRDMGYMSRLRLLSSSNVVVCVRSMMRIWQHGGALEGSGTSYGATSTTNFSPHCDGHTVSKHRPSPLLNILPRPRHRPFPSSKAPPNNNYPHTTSSSCEATSLFSDIRTTATTYAAGQTEFASHVTPPLSDDTPKEQRRLKRVGPKERDSFVGKVCERRRILEAQ